MFEKARLSARLSAVNVNQFVVIPMCHSCVFLFFLLDKNGCLLHSNDIIHCALKNKKQNALRTLQFVGGCSTATIWRIHCMAVWTWWFQVDH